MTTATRTMVAAGLRWFDLRDAFTVLFGGLIVATLLQTQFWIFPNHAYMLAAEADIAVVASLPFLPDAVAAVRHGWRRVEEVVGE